MDGRTVAMPPSGHLLVDVGGRLLSACISRGGSDDPGKTAA
jgi:hypothetical protein